MIEDELRAVFARHEELAPPAAPVRQAIDRTVRRRRRRRLAFRAAGAGLAVLVAVSAPTLARDLVPLPLHGAMAPASTVPDRALNFLVLGLDGRSVGLDQAEMHYRADSVFIVHIPRDRSQAYLIALPRDLGVDIPGHGRGKINEAFHHGSLRKNGKTDLAAGAELTARTVGSFTGLSFDGTAIVTYDGLRKFTDAVGGVRICLDGQVTSFHTGRVFPAGCQELDGRDSLDLLRQRRGLPEDAHDRDRNGQRFVKGLLAKVASQETLTDPAKVLALLGVAGDGLIVDTGDMAVPDLVKVVYDVANADLVGIGWTFREGNIGQRQYQELDPLVSGSLFDAVRQDRLDEWVVAHPEHITR